VSLEVVTGCMFSGKTEELVRRLRRSKIAGQSVRAFKPAIDTRYHETHISTHLGGTFEAMPIETIAQMRGLMPEFPDVIGFDEAQFMRPGIVGFLEEAANAGVQVIVAGLDMDYMGKPFGPMPELLALADRVTKLHAVCVAPRPDGKPCGSPASRSYRVPKADLGERVQVGSSDVYEARCRACWGEQH